MQPPWGENTGMKRESRDSQDDGMLEYEDDGNISIQIDNQTSSNGEICRIPHLGLVLVSRLLELFSFILYSRKLGAS